jgi:hypothetical protein
LPSSAGSPPGVPRHIAWRGTIVDTRGATGTLTARARLVENREYPEGVYRGRFRCRGAGCPLRRGYFHPVYVGPPPQQRLYLAYFGARKPRNRYCWCKNPDPLEDEWAIACDFGCQNFRKPPQIVAEGALELTWRRPAALAR